MVQVAVIVDRSPVSPPSSPLNDNSLPPHFSDTAKYRTESRMSLDGTSEEDDLGSRGSGGDAKTPSLEMSPPRGVENSSPKSEGFSSPMSICGDDQPLRRRAVLDLSMPSAFSRKNLDRDRENDRSYSRAMVPPYSPMSSSASTSSSSGSPSATPEAIKMDEVSIHDIAKEVTDRRSHASSFQAASAAQKPCSANNNSSPHEFDLPRNFYGYYVYQLELASRYSSNLRNTPVGLPGSPDSRNLTAPLVGKVKPTMKADPKDEEVVSYGSLLEQALRNGLKRSPSDVPTGTVDKKVKTNVSPPPPPQAGTSSPTHQQVPFQVSPNSRTSSASQISVEDVAKTSLRELLHSKQMQDAKAQQHNYASSGMGSAHGSRSSSPSVNLKSLLEPQTREQLKNQPFRSAADLVAMSFANGFPKQMLHQNQNSKPINTPHIYPHVLTRPSSPTRTNGSLDLSSSQFLPHMSAAQHLSGGSGYKHKKLLEWTATDVRDWVATLNYCSEFADIFSQQSVDGVALTLLNESHLMKNFGMKLGPAIKLRCAVWEILGLCQAQAAQSVQQMQLPQFMPQKPIPVGHCIPQHHTGSGSKQ